MFANQKNQIKLVLPKFSESQIYFLLAKYHGDINQTINELISISPPKIELNVLAWFDYFDPLRVGLGQEEIIHALQLTYGSDIREFDFATSVKTMWPSEIPLSIKLSREVFAEPGEGMGIGIAEYARNISPVITDVSNLAKVLPSQLSRQLIYDTLKSCNYDKYRTLQLLQSLAQNNSNPPPIYQATAIQLFPATPMPLPSSLPPPASVPPPSLPPPSLHQPAFAYSNPVPPPVSTRCSRCQKITRVDQNCNKMSAILCESCERITHPSVALPIVSPVVSPVVPIVPLNSYSQGQTYTQTQSLVVSPHSGYRPPCDISPAVPAPPMSPIHPKRNKILRKALLIGINYHGQRGELRGCCNDVREIYKLLINTYDWSSSDLRILADEDLHLPNQLSSSRPRETKPTKQNILENLKWLNEGVLPGDALFFHYSGHGAQQPDPNGIESDGMNETILPVDYQTEGMITDDEISKILIQTLPDGVRLTCIMDSCHSGTGCDLPYTWNSEERHFEVEPNPYYSLGDVLLFSGCQDSATSCDVSSTFSAPGGAMTTAFTKALKRNPYPTYDQLLDLLLQEMKSNGFQQRPQMSSSQEFEIGRPFSILEALPNTNACIGRTITQQFNSSSSSRRDRNDIEILFQILGLF